jgi:hypothetical protein
MRKKWSKVMGYLKYTLACMLLVFSCQSQALFMPEGFKIQTEDVNSDGGCGAQVVKSDSMLSTSS